MLRDTDKSEKQFRYRIVLNTIAIILSVISGTYWLFVLFVASIFSENPTALPAAVMALLAWCFLGLGLALIFRVKRPLFYWLALALIVCVFLSTISLFIIGRVT